MDSKKILIVGAGNVGRATGLGLLKLKHDVTFFDIDPSIISVLKKSGFSAINKIEEASLYEIALICVQTNLDEKGAFNLAPLELALAAIAVHTKSESFKCIVGIKSTVFPGTTQKLIEKLEANEPDAFKHIEIAYLPEFLRERSAEADFLNGPVSAVGSSVESVRALFKEILLPTCDQFIEFETYEEAELLKISHNLANAAEITFWNQIKRIADKFDIDTLKIKSAVQVSAESKYNQNYAYASGLPIGGKCLPKDLIGTISECRENEIDNSYLDGIRKSNS